MIFQGNYEAAVYSRAAATNWSSEVVQGRKVLLIEHDSALCALIILKDFVANPALGSIASFDPTRPYAAATVQDDKGKDIEVPVIGCCAPPTEQRALEWWLILEAAIWRLADLCKVESEMLAVSDPRWTADNVGAMTIRVVGESNVESIITSAPLASWVTEHDESARAAAAIFSAAVAFVNVRAGVASTLTADQTAQAQIAIAGLSKEQKKVQYMARVRAALTAAGVVVGAWMLGK